jgi:hypothetical protein
MKITIDIPGEYTEVVSRVTQADRTLAESMRCLEEFEDISIHSTWIKRSAAVREEMKEMRRQLDDMYQVIREQEYKNRR